jgi:outer membrane protein TolC
MTRGIARRRHKWIAGLALAVGTGGLAGCTKPLYMTPETQHIASTVGLPADIATNPNVSNPSDTHDHRPPPTILDANREPRYMSLQEAMAIALERGTRGNPSSFLFQNFNLGTSGLQSGFNGSYNDDLVSFAGRGVQGDDSIRAFALDPAIQAAEVEGALAKFDARFTTSMTWRKQDQQVANIFNNFNNGDFAAFSAGLVKPLPTGGVANITFENNYTKLGAVPQGFAVINPSYTPSLTFSIEQPLLRDYGVDINQLLPTHPGSTQFAFRPTGGRAEGILVTRIRADQAKAEFEREVNFLIFNTELAYWSLYGRYYTKYATEQALKQAYITWEQLQQLQVAGLQTKQGVAQARAQFEDFRLQYLVALQNVLEGERRLRGILGLPLEDNQRIVPADTPVLAPYKPEWNTSLAEALNNRPELRMTRQELKVQQLNVMLQENNVRPDLRVGASYNINSIGNRLDGPGPIPSFNAATGQVTDLPGNALGSLADNRFNNWTAFVRFDYPFGYRDAHAALKVAQLNLARSHVVLKNQERKAEFFLGSLYQQLAAYHEQIKLQQAKRIALGTQLQGQFERVKIGKDPLIQLLDAQRSFTGSIQAESDAIVSYNVAIAGFHLAKGTIMDYNGVTICDGPLPAAVAERAADHFAARSASLKLRERPNVAPSLPPAGTPLPLPGVADHPPPPEALDAPKGSTEPPLAPPGGPMVVPPTPPRETLPLVPREPKPKTDGPANLPAPLPGVSMQNFTPAGPTMPAGGSEPAMPATPVSKYRPQ